MKDQKKWFSVRCVFEHNKISREGLTTYEERIIILRADNPSDAITRGKEEAGEYVEFLDDVSFTGYIDTYELFDKTVQDKTEIYALMRDSKLEKQAYLQHFFSTGAERSTKIE